MEYELYWNDVFERIAVSMNQIEIVSVKIDTDQLIVGKSGMRQIDTEMWCLGRCIRRASWHVDYRDFL